MSLYPAATEPDLTTLADDLNTIDCAADVADLEIASLSPARPTPLHSDEINLAFYTAIVGKAPKIDPVAGHTLIPPMPLARPQRSWSPMVLSIYLRDAYRQSTMRLHKPDFAAWLRQQSVVAKKRLHETHHRLVIAPRQKRAA